MFASQYIYTACGKNKTGAFSVWSKSDDITTEECNEISEIMAYKRTANLPYEPTQEEIDRLFPIKFAYFDLSSGRKCMAQSTFIGKVYSDNDMRSGNYITHAFVFDKHESICPMTYIGHSVFKRFLTYEEWHENDAPESLPVAELEEYGERMKMNDAQAFLNASRKEFFLSLLQSVLNAYDENDKVTFYDNHENLILWYRTLSLFIPKKIQTDLHFCTIFSPKGNAAFETEESNKGHIMIRNVSQKQNPHFSYSDEISQRRYAFDFEKNLVRDNIPLCAYVSRLKELLGGDFFAAVSLVNDVGVRLDKYNVNLSTAYEIYNLETGNLSFFDTVESLSAVLGQYAALKNANLGDVADTLHGVCVVKRHYPYSPSLLEIYGFIYENAASADKNAILDSVIMNLRAFDILKDDAEVILPFPDEGIAAYLLAADNARAVLDKYGNNFGVCTCIFRALTNSIGRFSDEDRKRVCRLLADIMLLSIKRNSSAQTSQLRKILSSSGDMLNESVVKLCISILRKQYGRITDVCPPEFYLELAEGFENSRIGAAVVSIVLSECSSDESFIDVYNKRRQANPGAYSAIEKYFENDENFEAFMLTAKRLRFAGMTEITEAMLDDYFETTYMAGKENGIFNRKTAQYLCTFPGIRRIDKAVDLYKKWFLDLEDDRQVLDSIESLMIVISNVDDAALMKYAEQKTLRAVDPIYKRLTDNKRKIPHRFSAVKKGFLLRRALKWNTEQDKKDRINIAERMKSGKYYLSLGTDDGRDFFVKYFLSDCIVFCMTIMRDTNGGETIRMCFEPLYDSCEFENSFMQAVRDMDKQYYVPFLTSLIEYFVVSKDEFAAKVEALVIRYLDTLGKAKSKKQLDVIVLASHMYLRSKVRAFADDYLSEHQSFLGRLFGKKDKKHNGGNED